MNKIRIVFSLAVLVGISTTILFSKTLKVPSEYVKIQSAINAASVGDTVLVADGAYTENIVINKKIVLASIYIVDNDRKHIDNTILIGKTATHTDSGSVVTIEGAVDTTTVLTGFTITGGHGNRRYYAGANWTSQEGGGIFIVTTGGGARISNNIITRNMTRPSVTTPNSSGGGISVVSLGLNTASYSICENNIIRNNAAHGNQTSTGGGIYMRSSGRITGNIFIQNVAGGWGGAIGVEGPFTVTIDRCYLNSNFSGYIGGGIYSAGMNGAGAINVTVTNSIIVRNNAPFGSAFHMDYANMKLINNTITEHFGDNPVIRLRQSLGGNRLWLVNNIIYNPFATIQVASSNGTIYSANNLFNIDYAGTGNIAGDPKIVVHDSLYRLQPASPCIGAGNASVVLGGVTFNSPSIDYLGNSRPLPGINKPDIGALQYSSGLNLHPASIIISGNK